MTTSIKSIIFNIRSIGKECVKMRKEYETPTIDEVLFSTENIMKDSGIEDGSTGIEEGGDC